MSEKKEVGDQVNGSESILFITGHMLSREPDWRNFWAFMSENFGFNWILSLNNIAPTKSLWDWIFSPTQWT